MTMRLSWLAALALALTLVPGAQAQNNRSHRHDDEATGDWLARCRRGDSGERDQVKFCEERTMGWRQAGGQSLTVDASPNGGVSVTGWDKDSVAVQVRIQAWGDDDQDARELAQGVRVTIQNGVLTTEGPHVSRHSGWAVSFEIMAPRRVDLDLQTDNGPLEVADVTGRLRLQAQNGPLDLSKVGGDVRAHAQNGPLHVELTGSRWDGEGLDAETQNGPLTLLVPEGYNAQLETGTVNGPMDIGFPITVQGQIGMGSRRRITTTLGSGGPTVRVVTTNGPAVLRRS
jgi:hypothetical protein